MPEAGPSRRNEVKFFSNGHVEIFGYSARFATPRARCILVRHLMSSICVKLGLAVEQVQKDAEDDLVNAQPLLEL